MSVNHNLEQWIAQLDYDDTCDISDKQVSDLIRNYAELEQKLAGSQREFRAADATIENLQMQLQKMATENAYLLNGAARELNTSWMFHKTMLGAQAALVCLSHGYQATAREWLEGTTDEAGAEIPDDISVGELHEWFESNMVSNDGKSGFLTRVEAEVKIRAEIPNTDAFLAEVRAQGVEMFAAHKRERQQALRSRSMRMSEEAAGMAADAEDFADQLRKGVQS